MHLFSNYLLILVLMVTWPVLLLLFLLFSAWLDRFAGQPPKWVLRKQQAAQARAEALSAAGARPAIGRTRYWHPPTGMQPARSEQGAPSMAARDRRAAHAGAVPTAAQGQPLQEPPQGGTGQAPQGRPATRRPSSPVPRPARGAPRRPGVIDEPTEPMVGYPVDRLPPEPAEGSNPERRRPPSGWTAPGSGVPPKVPAAWREGPRP